MPRLLAAACSLTLLALTTSSVSAAPNMALGKPATASATYALTASPSKAFDGDTTTAWNAGGNPTQWIEVDLGSDEVIGQAHMKAAQVPAGNATHVITGRTSGGTTVTLGTYTGYITQGQWLTVASTNSTPVRYVRVTTTASTSWVAWFEIELNAGATTPALDDTWGRIKASYR